MIRTKYNSKFFLLEFVKCFEIFSEVVKEGRIFLTEKMSWKYLSHNKSIT